MLLLILFFVEGWKAEGTGAVVLEGGKMGSKGGSWRYEGVFFFFLVLGRNGRGMDCIMG